MKPLVLITGGQKGIGFGIAKELVSAEYTLALISEFPDNSDTVQKALSELGTDVTYFQHDLKEISKIKTLLDRIETDLGPISSLISNAGVSPKVRGDMLDLTIESYDHVMEVNLKGAYFLAQQVARRMILRDNEPYRSIIFITSISAEVVTIERAEYCISKAGASMMCKLFATRLASENIGVFEIRPGIIKTDMTAPVNEKYNQKILGGLVPANRWGQPRDIGSVVLPLVQGKMDFANGAVIPVDGGLSIRRL